MNIISTWLPSPLIHALGWTLIHALWQGAIIAMVLGFLLVLMKRFSARARYAAGMGALFLILVLSAITFQHAYAEGRRTIILTAPSRVDKMSHSRENETTASQTEQASSGISLATRFEVYFSDHLPAIVTLWLMGILIEMLRLLAGLATIQRLRHYRSQPAPQPWNRRLQAISRRLRLNGTVTLLQSGLAKAPMVIGHFKPVILVPVSFFTQLPESQIEAILTHELAHVLRRDYLVNLLQSLVETLFFFHPGVRWISRQTRLEREHCCDDIAMHSASGRLGLAKALLALEEGAATAQAVAFLGQKGTLLRRINRLLEPQRPAGFSQGFATAFLLLATLLVMGVGLGSATAAMPQSMTAPQLTALQTLVDAPKDTVKQNHVKMQQSTIALSKAGDIELSGEFDAIHESRPDYNCWLMDLRNGEVICHLQSGDLEKQGDAYAFKVVLHLEVGFYQWFVPQIGITIARYLDPSTVALPPEAPDAPVAVTTPPAEPTPPEDLALPIPDAAPVAPAEPVRSVIPSPESLEAAPLPPDVPESRRTIDSVIRETGKPKRRIRATIVNGRVEAFRLNNITFLEKDILGNWDYIVRVLGEIESHRYVYRKPGEARVPADGDLGGEERP